MEKIKIIFVHPSQLSERWLNYYHLDELQNAFDIEYWDCSALANPNFKAKEMQERPYLQVIKNIGDFKENINRISKDSLIVNDLHANVANYPLYMNIAKRFNHRIYFDFFANTQGVHKSKLFSKLATSNLKDLICYILIRRKFHFYVFSSRYSSDGRYRINHPDFEVYQKVAKDSINNNLSNYVVYVDNFFPFHPDILNRDPHVDPTRLAPLFYGSLNSFFSKVEQHFGCKVVIAAHPSSVYTNNPFDGRDIIYNKTCELIKDCTAVCMHTSNALSYAILFNKPLALLTNKAFQQARLEFMRLENISNMLSMKLINTDSVDDINYVFNHVSKDFTEFYKKEYLIADPKKTNAELFVEYFKLVHDCLCGK